MKKNLLIPAVLLSIAMLCIGGIIGLKLNIRESAAEDDKAIQKLVNERDKAVDRLDSLNQADRIIQHRDDEDPIIQHYSESR